MADAPHARLPRVPLPRDWPAHVKTGVVQAVALAHLALVQVRGWRENSPLQRVRLAARLEAGGRAAGR